MDAESCGLIKEAITTALKGHVGTANISLLLQEAERVSEKQKILKDFFAKLIKSIKTCTDGIQKVRIQLARERALKRFHQLRIESLPALWSKVFDDLGVAEEKAVILQSINRLIFNSIVLEQFTSRYATPPKEVSVSTMYSDEENAVRYASGYVVKVLKKQYEKKKGVKARQFMECLLNMSARNEGKDCSTYYDYTKAWIKLVNRGGLFEINNDSFLFFRAIESHVQETLHSHLLSGADKQEYLSKLLGKEDIQLLWSKLSTDIDDNDSSCELLAAVIEKWVTLRGFAQVSSWVDDYKAATAEKVKKKKALRKSLAKNEEEKSSEPAKKKRKSTRDQENASVGAIAAH